MEAPTTLRRVLVSETNAIPLTDEGSQSLRAEL